MRLSGLTHRIKRKKWGCIYEKNTCAICSQVCYNKKDLDMHMEREHTIYKNEKGKETASMEV
jgi:hypothetical protein